MGILLNIYHFAEAYTFFLAWVVIPLAHSFLYFRVKNSSTLLPDLESLRGSEPAPMVEEAPHEPALTDSIVPDGQPVSQLTQLSETGETPANPTDKAA